jgi:hypothetical protein
MAGHDEGLDNQSAMMLKSRSSKIANARADIPRKYKQ